MSENCAVKLRNFTNSRQVDAQVERHKRNRTSLKQNKKGFLPRNATQLCQQLDSFTIQELMCVWRHEWEQKSSLILSKNWSYCPRSFENSKPKRPYFMNLVVNCVSEVDSIINHGGISLV